MLSSLDKDVIPTEIGLRSCPGAGLAQDTDENARAAREYLDRMLSASCGNVDFLMQYRLWDVMETTQKLLDRLDNQKRRLERQETDIAGLLESISRLEEQTQKWDSAVATLQSPWAQ